MSNLQQKKREPIIEEDVEAPLAPKKYDAAASPSSALFMSATSLHRSNNPALLARMVQRNVFYLLTSEEDQDDITTSGGIIALLKDIVVGITIGMAAVSILIFLNHKDVIHVQGANSYRNMGLQMIRNPETRALIEETLGLKFIEADQYQKKFAQINSLPADIIALEERTKKFIADLEVAKKKHAAIKPGYDNLALNPMFGLDKFCGECSWNGGYNCFMRLTYLMSKYGLQTVKVKLELMKSTPQCVRPGLGQADDVGQHKWAKWMSHPPRFSGAG